MSRGDMDEPESETSEGWWEDDEALTIHRLTRRSFGKGSCLPYAAYRNEPSPGRSYTCVCLLVKAGPHGNRSENGKHGS